MPCSAGMSASLALSGQRGPCGAWWHQLWVAGPCGAWWHQLWVASSSCCGVAVAVHTFVGSDFSGQTVARQLTLCWQTPHYTTHTPCGDNVLGLRHSCSRPRLCGEDAVWRRAPPLIRRVPRPYRPDLQQLHAIGQLQVKLLLGLDALLGAEQHELNDEAVGLHLLPMLHGVTLLHARHEVVDEPAEGLALDSRHGGSKELHAEQPARAAGDRVFRLGGDTDGVDKAKGCAGIEDPAHRVLWSVASFACVARVGPHAGVGPHVLQRNTQLRRPLLAEDLDGQLPVSR
eukprot:scaffold40234_cov68-Phaeocystis_antarctica.AAC.2